MSKRPVIAVVYDHGAVSPWEIGIGLSELADIVFLAPATAHNARVRPALEQVGTVVSLDGDPGDDRSLLAGHACDGS